MISVKCDGAPRVWHKSIRRWSPGLIRRVARGERWIRGVWRRTDFVGNLGRVGNDRKRALRRCRIAHWRMRLLGHYIFRGGRCVVRAILNRASPKKSQNPIVMRIRPPPHEQ